MEGERFGPYYLVRRLGHGGMGEVFLAYGPMPSGPAGLSVVKLVRKELLGNDVAIRRFEDEARLLAHLENDSVARLYDAGFVEDAPFMALEYISGLPLSKATAKARLPMSVAVPVATQLLSALAAAHAAKGDDGRPLKIVHRDVSPQNLMLGVDGRVKLIDFGIARSTKKSVQTMVGQFVGKMRYAPPEQLLGDDVDARADVFAAGVVITELFSGRRYYEKMNDSEAVTAALDESWTSPSLDEAPEPLREPLSRATARRAVDRYPSAIAFQAALVDAIGTLRSGGAAETRAFLASAFPAELRRLQLIEEEAQLAGRQFFSRGATLSEETTHVSVISVTPVDPTRTSSPGLSALSTSADWSAPDLAAPSSSPPPLLSSSGPSSSPTPSSPSSGPSSSPAPLLSSSGPSLSPAPPLPSSSSGPSLSPTPPLSSSSPTPPLTSSSGRRPTAPLWPPSSASEDTALTAPPSATLENPLPRPRGRRLLAAAAATAGVVVVVVVAASWWSAPPSAPIDAHPPAPSSASSPVDAASRPTSPPAEVPGSPPAAMPGSPPAAMAALPGSPPPTHGAVDPPAPPTEPPSPQGSPPPTHGAVDPPAPPTKPPSPTEPLGPVEPTAPVPSTKPKTRAGGRKPPVVTPVTPVVTAPTSTPLNRMLAKARAECAAVPSCVGLPASVDAEKTGLDDLLTVQQRVRACLAACETH